MWRRFSLILGLATTGALGLCLATVLAIDPLGISPVALPLEPVLTESNRRFMVPRVIRSGDYDSYIAGTSTLHHVDPALMDAGLGGRFANVATHGATPYEQRRVVDLILRQPAPPRLVVWGIDQVWCAAEEPPRYNPASKLPDWLYDEGTAGKLMHVLNMRMMELSGKRVLVALGAIPPNLAPSGYRSDLPPDASWSAATAASRLWGPGGARAVTPDALVPAATAAPGAFPALDALAEVLERLPQASQAVLVMTPLHLAALPEAGAERAERLARCKRRVADIARPANVTAVDYLRPSALARRDDMFWDHDHTRLSFGARLAGDIGRALAQDAAADDAWSRLDTQETDHAAR